MIIVRTPLRINITSCGGGDYPEYYNRFPAMNISMAIDKYVYSVMRYRPEIYKGVSRIQYSKVEDVVDNSQIEHRGVRGVLEHLNEKAGVEISHFCDLPSNGLAGSSAFICSMIKGFHHLRGQDIGDDQVIADCNYVERVVNNEHGGHADPYGCVVPGVKRVSFSSYGITHSPFLMDTSGFLERCILLYTNGVRQSYAAAATYTDDESLHEKHEIQRLNWVISDYLQMGNWDAVGEVMDETWKRKRAISSIISNDKIDTLYEKALEVGSAGGRLAGSGQAGYFLFVLQEGVDKGEFASQMGLSAVDFGVDELGIAAYGENTG
jgi:D-glycero-alpha-D-manno-heptose-7-phosphate kinase